MKSVITGISGPRLTPGEAEALRRHPPAGVILFARNIESPDQLRALTASLREVLPGEAVLMVDQEGGRVARLRAPHWANHPPAGAIGALPSQAAARAAWLTGALIGLQCADAGFDVACAPVLDLRHPGASDVVGDRSFGADPEVVATLGAAMARGLLAAGIQPVAKHAPGHGRALVDSHHHLPVIEGAELDADIAPFIACAAQPGLMPWLMTAHILFPAWDADHPATLSARIIEAVLRGRIGFDGLLVSDDLAMHALDRYAGDAPQPAAELARLSLEAGCDLALHCTGAPEETEAVLAACPDVTPQGFGRLQRAWATARAARDPGLDFAALLAERNGLLALQPVA